MGNPNLAEVRAKGTAMTKASAEQFAANALPIIPSLKAEGASLRKFADTLNQRRVATARGGQWAAAQGADILCAGRECASQGRKRHRADPDWTAAT